MKRYLCCAVLLLTFFTLSANTILTTVDKDKIRVGERFRLYVSIPVHEKYIVSVPDPQRDFGDLNVRAVEKKTVSHPQTDTSIYAYTLISFSTENNTIPMLRYVVQNDAVLDTLFSQEISLEVVSLIPQGDNVDIKGLKSQQAIGRSPFFLLWWSALFIILSLFAYFLIRRLINQKSLRDNSTPPKPAYEEALESMLLLEGKNLIEKGYIREHVFELSEIFKRYISRRFSTNAREFTTEEMIEWLNKSEFSKEELSCAKWFFETSDPVKFARYIPEISVLRRFSDELRSFLELSRELPQSDLTTASVIAKKSGEKDK
ncbi:hypothetical protein CHISP_0709 [Chitinispirillum alkaliphilum]|nr:hypothetical protein CHISP_0709 [Chitinispirillum alkaliphilum]